MSPFEKLNNLKDTLREKAKTEDPNSTITKYEHYKEMLNLLQIIGEELKSAEYNYVIENTANGSYHTFGELTLESVQLTDNLIILKPVAVEDISTIDMSSMVDVFAKLKEEGRIKEDIILMPPYVDILKAKLVVPGQENNDENVT